MTSATVSQSRALTTYLRRATWGLPVGRQQELYDELEEHILSRTEHLLSQGAGADAALALALRDVGSPLRLCLSLSGVHNMPRLFLTATGLALTIGLTLHALAQPQGTALPVLTSRPVGTLCLPSTSLQKLALPVISTSTDQTCYRNAQAQPAEGIFVPADALQNAVNAQGGQAEYLGGQYLSLRFPDGSALGLPPAFVQDGQAYVSAEDIVNRGLLNQGNIPPITLSGFQSPTLTVGGAVLHLGGAGAPYGRDLYRRMQFGLVVSSVYGGIEGIPADTVGFGLTGTQSAEHQIATTLQAGEVVMLVTAANAGKTVVDMAEVAAGGLLTIESDSQHLRFVSTPAYLTMLHDSADRVPALLVRVTNVPLNQVRQGIFIPAQATSDSK